MRLLFLGFKGACSFLFKQMWISYSALFHCGGIGPHNLHGSCAVP